MATPPIGPDMASASRACAAAMRLAEEEEPELLEAIRRCPVNDIEAGVRLLEAFLERMESRAATSPDLQVFQAFSPQPFCLVMMMTAISGTLNYCITITR